MYPENIPSLHSTSRLQSCFASTCYLGTCKACLGIDTSLVALIEDNMIDNITYRQKEAVDRSSLETVTKSSNEFVKAFCEKLRVLIPHSFIATQQASFFNKYV